MIIEDLDALKSWLSKTLEPICDADPSALAKYVVALLKKDKKEKELKVLCIDQLDVFLQKETQSFVDKLFEAVNTRSYLSQFEQPLPTARTDAAQCQDKGDVKNELQPNREDERDRRFTRIATRSPPPCSSRYRDDRRVDDRKKEDRNRRRDHDHTPLRRDSYWERYGRRQGLRCSWSKDRPRVRDRDGNESQTRSRSSSRAKSKERDSGKAKHDQEGPERPEPVETYTPAPSVPDSSPSLFPIPVPCLGSAITVVVPKQHGGSNAEGWSPFAQEQQLCQSSAGPQLRKRCCDYDEKGFCMRGDLCPFDHGSDPVVVDDVSLPGILPFQTQPLPMIDSQPTPGLPPPQSLVTPRPPLNLRPIVPPPCSLPPSLPPVAGPPPPLPPLQPSGMDAPPNSITSSVPNIIPSKMCVRPPQVPLPLFSRGTYDMDMYNPESPSLSRPMYRHRAQVQRPNLIGLTAGDMDLPPREKSIGSGSVRIVVESNRRKRTLDPQDGAVLAKKPWFDKTIKPNHQGFIRRVPFGSGNAKLYIRQIPAELNNISKLNEHFSKFGTIVNLQVAYQNDPMSALVQFASHEQARRAMVSTEAVLNNRFIKVHWYREDIAVPTQSPAVLQSTHKPPSAAKPSVKDRLGPRPSIHPEDPLQSQNAEKMLVRNRLGFPSKAAPGGPVFAPSAGRSMTVYGPREVKGEQKVTPFLSLASSTETLRKKQEALKLQHDVRKKKQEILEKHIETQKLLILKLEKNRTIKCEDKALIMETLTTLTNKIMQLQADMKAASSGSSLKPIKTKTQAQKELLDAELDLYKKMQAGEDVTQLRVKYTQLQLEAAKRGVLGTGRVTMGVGAWGRGVPHGRGRGERGVRGRGRGPPMHAVIDHRPRALDVSGFTDSDRVDLLPHFAQFGEIEDCHIDESTDHAVIAYRTRTEAEAAAVHGGKLNGQKLKLAWHKPTKALTPTDAEEAEPEDEDFQEEALTDNAVLQDDDEEDDDNEPRSWRR